MPKNSIPTTLPKVNGRTGYGPAYNGYHRFEPAIRHLLLDLALFEPFDVEFARILSGNSRAGELMGELQRDTSMFLYNDTQHCRFWPVFRQYLLWQQEREYSEGEQKRLYGRAALYYELHDDYNNALECYTKSGEYRKVSELLIKNSELHPGLAHYDEMEDYYHALPREEILASPALIAGMSMLCSICLDYEESEAWYQELKQYLRLLILCRKRAPCDCTALPFIIAIQFQILNLVL